MMYVVMLKGFIFVLKFILLILDALISYVCFRSDAFICVHCIVFYSSLNK